MRLRTLALITILALATTGFGKSHAKVVNHVEASIVRITGTVAVQTWTGIQQAQYVCTGFVIAPNRVMTAAHCIGDPMFADGSAALVLKADTFLDLAVVQVETKKQALGFRERNVVRGEALTAIGYGFGFTRPLVLEVIAMLVDYAPLPSMPPGLLVQGGYIGGMSGGPVVDDNGEIVSIVQQTAEGAAGYGVGSLLIRAFLVGVL